LSGLFAERGTDRLCHLRIDTYLIGDEEETARAHLEGGDRRYGPGRALACRNVSRAHRAERTFGDVAEDWLRHGERKRGLKRSTLYDYRRVLDAYLLPAFGDVELQNLTAAMIERWHSGYRRSRTAEKLLIVLRGILNYAVRQSWLADNAATAVEHHPVRYPVDYDLYSREEVDALVRSAASEQDGAIYGQPGDKGRPRPTDSAPSGTQACPRRGGAGRQRGTRPRRRPLLAGDRRDAWHLG